MDLFVKLFGKDYLDYVYTRDHGTQIAVSSDPRETYTYDHDKWEASFEETFQERAVEPMPGSAVLLKELSNNARTVQEPSTDLDGITPLDTSAMSDVSDDPSEISGNTSEADHDDAVLAESLVSLQAVASVSDAQVKRDATATFSAIHLHYGLPLESCTQFQQSLTLVLPDHKSALVNSLVEGRVGFKGNSLIDMGDLVALRGCQPTSQENYLTNFVIEGYLSLIAKEGSLQGKEVEWLGWECFEKAVGRQPAAEILKRKAPLLAQDIILVPCNPGQSKHWFLIAVLPKQHQILVLDSLAGAFIKPSAKKAAIKMWNLLTEIDSTIEAREWNFFGNKPSDIPQQCNDYDCGVFLCAYAKNLVLGCPIAGDILTFRKSMVLELHEGSLR